MIFKHCALLEKLKVGLISQRKTYVMISGYGKRESSRSAPLTSSGHLFTTVSNFGMESNYASRSSSKSTWNSWNHNLIWTEFT